jgi:choline dehydrogenase-like flavoprotein
MDILDRHEHVGSFALLIADSAPSGRVRGTVAGYPAIQYDVAQADARRMHALMTHAGQMCLAAGATKLLPGVRSQPVLDDAAAFRTFCDADLSPSDVAWLSYHPLGTCKMGRDPRTSVVDIDHQAHDLPGLFVVDGSTVPGVLGVNPQLTIMAMATRAARGIAETL